MSRRRAAVKRKVIPDARYNDVLVTRFMNGLMKDGKKGVAEKIFYGALTRAESKLEGIEAAVILHEALENVKPKIEVRPRRVGGSTYQIPVEVSDVRKEALAIRWMIKASRSRSGHSMMEKLSGELLDAYNNRGNAVRKREEVHKMAESNRAYAHYVN